MNSLEKSFGFMIYSHIDERNLLFGSISTRLRFSKVLFLKFSAIYAITWLIFVVTDHKQKGNVTAKGLP